MSRYTGGGGFLPLTWWFGGVSIDLWFAQSKYFDTTVGDGVPITNYLSCSRASTATALNSAGAWVSFGNDTLRITDLGLTNENSRTNSLLNSGAPATQTTASLGTGSYTLWVEGSGSALASAGSASITGAASATAGNPNTFTVTVAGTVVVTVTGSLSLFQLENGQAPTSYIPTTGATVTRAADLITAINNLDTVTNLAAWSFYGNLLAIDSNNINYHMVNRPFYDVCPAFTVGNTQIRLSASPGFTNLGATLGSGLNATGVKVASAMDASGGSIVVNNGTLSTSSGAGFVGGGRTFSFDGYSRIQRIAFWSGRLPDATLQGLST